MSVFDALILRIPKGSPITAVEHDNNLQVIGNALDGITYGGPVKFPCRVVSTTNVSIASPPTSVDGISLNIGDRILLVGQANPSENGIYRVNPLWGWSLDEDWSLGIYKRQGQLIYVREGVSKGKTLWEYVGSNIFTQVSFGGSSSVSIHSSRCVYVDTQYGDDLTGDVDRVDLPFRTFNALFSKLNALEGVFFPTNYRLIVYVRGRDTDSYNIDFNAYTGNLLSSIEFRFETSYQNINVTTYSSLITQDIIFVNAFDGDYTGGNINFNYDAPPQGIRNIQLFNIKGKNVQIFSNNTFADNFNGNLFKFYFCKDLRVFLVRGVNTQFLETFSFQYHSCFNVEHYSSTSNTQRYIDEIVVNGGTDISLNLDYQGDNALYSFQQLQIQASDVSNLNIYYSVSTGSIYGNAYTFNSDLFINKCNVEVLSGLYGSVFLKDCIVSLLLDGNFRNVRIQNCQIDKITTGAIFNPDSYLVLKDNTFIFDSILYPFSLLLDFGGILPILKGNKFVIYDSANKIGFYWDSSVNAVLDLTGNEFVFAYDMPVFDKNKVIITDDGNIIISQFGVTPIIYSQNPSAQHYIHHEKKSYLFLDDFSVFYNNFPIYEGTELYFRSLSDNLTGIKKVGKKEGILVQDAPIIVEEYTLDNQALNISSRDTVRTTNFAVDSAGNKYFVTGGDVLGFDYLSGPFTLYSLLLIDRPVNISEVSVRIRNFVNAGNVYVAVYRVNNLTLQGGLVFSAMVSISSNGVNTVGLGANELLLPGVYYIYVANTGNSGDYEVLVNNAGITPYGLFIDGNFYNSFFDDVNGIVPGGTVTGINNVTTLRPFVAMKYTDAI